MKQNIISDKTSIKQALELFNQLAPEAITQTTLFVLNVKKQMVGTLTEGDIRRSLLSGMELKNSVENCMNKSFKFFNDKNYSADLIHQLKEKK